MKIPENARLILETLKKNGFEAFLVGGCVRDILMNLPAGGPKDWDVAASADPGQIQKIFPEGFCNNEFGTVNVNSVEITPFRTEEKYTDKRHPDKVKWAKTIEEDLSRRDFTINSIALEFPISNFQVPKIIDPFDGQKDIKKKIIKAVGNPNDRFNEDALRLMRAVRFASVFGFSIEPETLNAIERNADLIRMVSRERIRDEFLKIINCRKASEGMDLLRRTGLLENIMPELLEGYKVDQSKHHIYDVYEHSLRSLDFAAKKGFKEHVRIAALLHDVGKPRTKKGEGEKAIFYNHELVGAKMTARILERLKFPKKDIQRISNLVKFHLFYYNVGEVTESSVRRLLKNVGRENVDDLLEVRMADRIGSGCPKAEPYKLRHLRYLIEKVSQDAISVKMLKVNGGDVMKILGIKPGPKIGEILDILLGQALDDPSKNSKDILEKEIKKLGGLKDGDLEKEAEEARKGIEKVETKKEQMTKSKYWVT